MSQTDLILIGEYHTKVSWIVDENDTNCKTKNKAGRSIQKKKRYEGSDLQREDTQNRTRLAVKKIILGKRMSWRKNGREEKMQSCNKERNKKNNNGWKEKRENK